MLEALTDSAALLSAASHSGEDYCQIIRLLSNVKTEKGELSQTRLGQDGGFLNTN